MTKMRIVTALAALLVAGSAAAATPDNSKPSRIVLEAKAGSVMASNGGEYRTVNAGKPLSVGESLMLGEGANATVVYYYTDAQGKVVRKCSERYMAANTYVIDDVCAATAAAWDGESNTSDALWIVGAALVGAAIIESMGDEPVGPLSTGPNGTIVHF